MIYLKGIMFSSFIATEMYFQHVKDGHGTGGYQEVVLTKVL